MQGTTVSTQALTVENIPKAIHACEATIRNTLKNAVFNADNANTALQCLRAVLVFQAEIAILAKDWDRIPAIIEVRYSVCRQCRLTDVDVRSQEHLWASNGAGGYLGSCNRYASAFAPFIFRDPLLMCSSGRSGTVLHLVRPYAGLPLRPLSGFLLLTLSLDGPTVLFPALEVRVHDSFHGYTLRLTLATSLF
jgi:hypothetical protein